MNYLHNFVYLAYEDKPDGRMYIGKHSTNDLCDGYLGSFLDPSFKPTHKVILQYYKTEQGAIAGEIQWQEAFKVAEDPQYANRAYQTSTRFYYPWAGKTRSDTDKQKKSLAAKGRPKTLEHRKKLSEVKLGSTLSENHKRNIGLAGLGREVTLETREKIRSKKKGVPQTKEHKEKLASLRKGKKWWNNGTVETQAHTAPSPEWKRGRLRGKPPQEGG
jgi:hypothetical protein